MSRISAADDGGLGGPGRTFSAGARDDAGVALEPSSGQAGGMRTNPWPLSDDEYDQLAEVLDAISPFGLDGVIGLLHAVAVAPGLILPSAWLPVVAPNGFQQFDPGEVEQVVGLLFRLSGEVQDAVNHGQAIIPEANEASDCESFAAGYAAGAALDPAWLGDVGRWSFAAPFAYLGGRLDLLSAEAIAEFERNLAPDAKSILRRDLGTLVRAADTSFKTTRHALLEKSIKPTQQIAAARIGRNEPCPCGSGKKYKRCCLDTGSGATNRSVG